MRELLACRVTKAAADFAVRLFAAYLELAVRRSLPLMTRDKRLRQAAAELRLLWKAR
jgi:predicted nucleic acid-binding protein